MSMRQQGIALVAVLWVVVMLSVIAGSFALSIHNDIQQSSHELNQARAGGIIQAALNRVLYELAKPPQTQHLPMDGTPYRWAFAETPVLISVQDARGLVDLNQADKATLQKLFEAVQVEPDDAIKLADQVLDYRDGDVFAQLNGAEDDAYERAGLPYRSRDAPFASEEEVRLLLDMTPDIYARVLPYVTVHAKQAELEPELAPLLLLQKVIELEPAELDRLQQQREDRDNGKQASPDPEQDNISLRNGQGYHVRFEVQFTGHSLYTAEAVLEQGGFSVLPYHVVAWKSGSRISDLVESPEAKTEEP